MLDYATKPYLRWEETYQVMVQYLMWGPIHCQLLIPHHFEEHLYPIGLLQMSMIHR